MAGSGTAAPTRVLRAEDIGTILRVRGVDAVLDELIERLATALSTFAPDRIETPPRAGFVYDVPTPGLLEWMPALEVGRIAAVKTVGYHPANPTQRAQPSVVSTTSLYDPGSGRLLAVVDSTVLTALRTGAASAVASDVLAVDAPITVGVVGCGAQAVTQLHALSRVRTIDRVLVTDTDPAVAATLARRVRFLDRPVDVVPPLLRGRILQVADVVCTATTVAVGAGPVLDDGEHRPWLHVNAVGADFPGKAELPASLLRRALVCPDLLSQCQAEGECQNLDARLLGPDLATLVQQRCHYQSYRGELTVFDSTGWALEDLVAAELALDHAADLGLGVSVGLHASTADPHDPYREVA
jgi:ornithine cyclodeaminase